MRDRRTIASHQSVICHSVVGAFPCLPIVRATRRVAAPPEVRSFEFSPDREREPQRTALSRSRLFLSDGKQNDEGGRRADHQSPDFEDLAMTTEEKFHAAVNVIRSLPKNGSYQPSNEIMLRFYSYYKQATEGPCQQPKPAFWEVVKKAKWDAWTRLGNMSRTEAMNNYVEELKKIVETMSYTDKVAAFLGSLDTFYESVPQEDLELLVGPVLERMRSQPGSPLSGSPLVSRETSPHRVCNMTRHIASSLETSPASSHSASPLPPDTDGEEEEFIDTVESAPERSQKDTTKPSAATQKMSNGIIASDKSTESVAVKENPSELTNGYVNTSDYTEAATNSKQERSRQRVKKDEKSNAEFFIQIATTMQNLQRDLDSVTARVRSLEGQALQALAPQIKQPTTSSYLKWWPLPDCSPRLFTILILWPFLAQFLISYTQRYRQRRL